MEYTEKDLVKIAKRENNPKRNYLVVDPLQGKHIPVAQIAKDAEGFVYCVSSLVLQEQELILLQISGQW